MEQIYFIYKITNIVNNLIYIGQTSKTVQERFTVHCYTAFVIGLNTKFYNALRKYGRQNFVIETIDTAIGKCEADEKEKYWIKKLNSTNRHVGYNTTIGGEGGNTYQFKTEDEMKIIKNKISKRLSGGHNGNARSIKCKNIKNNEIMVFESGSECAEYFKKINYPFKGRELFALSKANRKYHLQKAYKDQYIFAYAEDEFYDYSFFKQSKGEYPVKLINCETHEEYIGLTLRECKYKANITNISDKVFYKNFKVEKIDYTNEQ